MHFSIAGRLSRRTPTAGYSGKFRSRLLSFVEVSRELRVAYCRGAKGADQRRLARKFAARELRSLRRESARSCVTIRSRSRGQPGGFVTVLRWLGRQKARLSCKNIWGRGLCNPIITAIISLAGMGLWGGGSLREPLSAEAILVGVYQR